MKTESNSQLISLHKYLLGSDASSTLAKINQEIFEGAALPVELTRFVDYEEPAFLGFGSQTTLSHWAKILIPISSICLTWKLDGALLQVAEPIGVIGILAGYFPSANLPLVKPYGGWVSTDKFVGRNFPFCTDGISVSRKASDTVSARLSPWMFEYLQRILASIFVSH